MSSIHLISTRFLTYKVTPLGAVSFIFILFTLALVSFLFQKASISNPFGISEGVYGAKVVTYDGARSLDFPMAQQNVNHFTKEKIDRFSLKYQRQTPLNNGKSAWLARNTDANIEAYFFDDGPVILPIIQNNAWQFKFHQMQLDLVDRRLNSLSTENVIPLLIPERAKIEITNNKIQYQRGIMTEWFINEEQGIEHGLTINDHDVFHRQNTLTVLMDIEGLDHTQGKIIDSRNLKFDSILNRSSLNYSKLAVVDRNGRSLPAEFDLKGTQIAIIIDISQAEFPVTIDPIITTTSWQTKGSGLYGESYGHAVASVGDVTGNGYDDVLVSDPYAENSPSDIQTTNRGTVFLYEGSATGLSFSPVWSFTENQLDSTGTHGANYGYSVAAAGDINQDGFNDFIVSAKDYSSPTTDYVGRVYVYLGAKGGVSSRPFTIESDDGGGTNFGSSVAAADVNGDNRNDLVIGHPQYHNPSGTGLDQGRVLVFLANSVSAFDPANPQTLFIQPANWIYTVNGDAAGFGSNVANAGDVDADGYSDIIIGSPGYTNGQFHEGAAYIFYGGPLGISARNFWRVESNQIEALLGLRVAGVGDTNGDNISDVMVSAIAWDATASNEGIALLYLGVATTGPSNTGPSVIGPSIAEAWSYPGGSNSSNLNSIAGAGDINGDGLGDVIIGLQAYSNPENLEGRVLLFEGVPTGLGVNPSWSKESDTDLGQIGFSVAGGGDFNGDGYSDIIVGAPGVNTVGTAYAFYGAGNSDLEVTVTDSVDPVLPGTTYTYSVNINNYGPDPAKKVVLVNTLPNGAIFQSITTSTNWVCSEQSLVVTCTTDNIAANALVNIIDINLQFPNTAKMITNVATISANIIDPNTNNNTNSETTQVNTQPVANDLLISTDEDVTYTSAQSLPASDPDSDPISFTISKQSVNGVSTVQTNGTFSYQPKANYNGSDSFSYSVSDGITSASATVSITVNAINDAPVANNVLITLDEDMIYTGAVTASDLDIPANQLSFSLNQNAQNGNVVIAANGNYSYTPNTNFNGNDNFIFTVLDNGIPNLSSTGTVTISVVAVNDAPQAISQSLTSLEDTPLNGQLSATDTETPSNQLTYNVVASAGPSKGSVVILPNGSFTYTPFLNQVGADSFDFEVTDVGTPALSNIATVSITITNTNDSPVTQGLVITTDEDTPVSGQLIASDLETPVEQLVFSIEVAPTNGNVVIESGGQFEYTPGRDFSGNDSFIFKVADNGVPSNFATATVSITVNPINDPPVAFNGSINIIQNQTWGAFLLGTDAERDTLEYSLLTLPEKGSVDIYDTSVGAYTYTPNENATGPDSFTFKVFDGKIYSSAKSPGKISVFINTQGSGNVYPSSPTIISPEMNSIDVDATGVEFSWLASVDPDGDSLTYKVALCVEDPSVTCAPVPVNNQSAAIHYSSLIAMGGPGVGLALFGLLGSKRRKNWKEAILLVGFVIVMNACSNAAEEAQKSTFVKGPPVIVTHYETNLSPAKAYYWKVLVADGNGGVSESETRSFTTKP